MSQITYLDLLNFDNHERRNRIASEAIKILCLNQDSTLTTQTDLSKFACTLGVFFELFNKLERHPKELSEFVNFTLPENEILINEFLAKHNVTMLQFFTFYSYLKNHHFRITTSRKDTYSQVDELFFDHLEITTNQYTALCIAIPSKLFSLKFWENLEAPENVKPVDFILSIIQNKEDSSKRKLKALQRRFIALLKDGYFTYKNEEGGF